MSEFICDHPHSHSLYQANYALMLYPNDPHFSLSQKKLLPALASINLLGTAQTRQRYLVGEDFLSLLCFMGCSPQIELFPHKDTQKAYCYIEVPEATENTQSIISKNVKAPRCPQCKANLGTWAQQLQQECIDTSCCPECGNMLTPHQLNWRKSAFFARNYIMVGNIYEAEALPEPKLLDHLENITHIPWKYAYIRLK